MMEAAYPLHASTLGCFGYCSPADRRSDRAGVWPRRQLMAAASQHPGMGATPGEGVTTFRVWAPFATGVAVAGGFNSWSQNATPLASEANGYWSADVATAKLGDQYKYLVTNPTAPAPLWKNDPYAKSMTNSAGNSIIASTDHAWQAEDYSTPPWNAMVIYE